MVTPTAILEAYNITGQVEVSALTPNSQAVVNFASQMTNTSDLRSFLMHYNGTDYGSDDPLSRLIFVGNETGEGTATDEASLDIEYIMGISNVTTQSWHVPPSPSLLPPPPVSA